MFFFLLGLVAFESSFATTVHQAEPATHEFGKWTQLLNVSSNSISPVNCGLTKNGDVECFGIAYGLPSALELEIAEKLTNVVDIVDGWGVLCALKKDATVRCIDLLINYDDEAHPRSIVPAGLANVKKVVINDHFACAIQLDNKFQCWGDRIPKDWKQFDRVADIGGTSANPCLLDLDGKLYCWYSDALKAGFPMDAVQSFGVTETDDRDDTHEAAAICAIYGPEKRLKCNKPGFHEATDGLKNLSKIVPLRERLCLLDSDSNLYCLNHAGTKEEDLWRIPNVADYSNGCLFRSDRRSISCTDYPVEDQPRVDDTEIIFPEPISFNRMLGFGDEFHYFVGESGRLYSWFKYAKENYYGSVEVDSFRRVYKHSPLENNHLYFIEHIDSVKHVFSGYEHVYRSDDGAYWRRFVAHEMIDIIRRPDFYSAKVRDLARKKCLEHEEFQFRCEPK